MKRTSCLLHLGSSCHGAQFRVRVEPHPRLSMGARACSVMHDPFSAQCRTKRKARPRAGRAPVQHILFLGARLAPGSLSRADREHQDFFPVLPPIISQKGERATIGRRTRVEFDQSDVISKSQGWLRRRCGRYRRGWGGCRCRWATPLPATRHRSCGIPRRGSTAATRPG
jgi:hypothetical protein